MMSSVEPAVSHTTSTIKIHQPEPEDYTAALPGYPLKIKFEYAKSSDENKKLVEKLHTDIIAPHKELSSILKKILQNGTILIKIYDVKSLKWSHGSDQVYFWDDKKRVLNIRTTPDLQGINIIEDFVFGVCLIQDQTNIESYGYANLKTADEFVRMHEKQRFDEVMAKNDLILQGVEKYKWPECLKTKLEKHTSFENYFNEVVCAYPEKNMSMYDRRCLLFCEEILAIYQKEFKEEVKKNLSVSTDLAKKVYQEQALRVIASLEKQLGLIEMIYNMDLQIKLIRELYLERAQKYHLELSLASKIKLKKEEIQAAKRHKETMQKLHDANKNDDLEEDVENANSLYELSVKAYEDLKKPLDEVEARIQEGEEKIKNENKMIFETSDDRLRAVEELAKIKEQLIRYDILSKSDQTMTQAAGVCNNAGAGAAIVPLLQMAKLDKKLELKSEQLKKGEVEKTEASYTL